jgi:hypothetical protein
VKKIQSSVYHIAATNTIYLLSAAHWWHLRLVCPGRSE